jgi:tetratricopeptide (TPR) repeat protein
LLAVNLQDQEDVSREQKSRARAIVDELDTLTAKTRYSDLFRGIVNYDAHLDSVAVEVTVQADEAQRLRYEARKAYYDGRMTDSISGWLDAMRKWDELLALPQFKKMVSRPDFIREHIDVVEKFAIILDNNNKVFSDVTDDPVPLRQLMWNKMFNESGEPELKSALDYAKNEYDTAVTEKDVAKRKQALETVEKHFAILSERYAYNNGREKWMQFGPFFDLCDQMIESLAYHLKTLTEQEKPLPKYLSLQNFVELMLQHDKELAKTKESTAEAVAYLQDKKFDEAQKSLDQAVSIWKNLLAKYPIILYNEKLPVRDDAIRTATLYAEAVKGQNKPLPDDFPLKELLKK